MKNPITKKDAQEWANEWRTFIDLKINPKRETLLINMIGLNSIGLISFHRYTFDEVADLIELVFVHGALEE